MHISSNFDSGNILVRNLTSPEDIQLEIRKDAGEDHMQWFHFRLTGARNQPVRLRLLNASAVSYPDGFQDYQACASYDRQVYFRVPTRYEDGVLTIDHTPEADSVYYAYFAPYSLERHADFLSNAQRQPGVKLTRLGGSVDGRDLDLLELTNPTEQPEPPKNRLWIIARQHPGETMAQWLVEGLVERLLDPNDPVALALRNRNTFYIIPNMNPDGSYRGHLRNNAAGANLNREWQSPSQERSPEVWWVRQAMEQHGVDLFLDVHGDEALPYNFISGAEGIPSWSEAAAERQARYATALVAASPDFQVRHGYPITKPGQANLKIASNWVAERFKCLALTLEQPFKDTADTPHQHGWSPERAKRLGRAQLDAMSAVTHLLRGNR